MTKHSIEYWNKKIEQLRSIALKNLGKISKKEKAKREKKFWASWQKLNKAFCKQFGIWTYTSDEVPGWTPSDIPWHMQTRKHGHLTGVKLTNGKDGILLRPYNRFAHYMIVSRYALDDTTALTFVRLMRVDLAAGIEIASRK